MLQAIAGYDPEDATTINLPVPDYAGTIKVGISSLQLGIPRAYFYEKLDPDIQAALDSALAVLKKLTASQRDIGPLATNDSYTSITDPIRIILTAEAYAYHQEFVSKTPDLYQPETLKRIRAGADVAAPAYIQSRRQLEQIRRSASKIFDTVDLLITPTVLVSSFKIDELLGDLNTLRSKELQMLHNTRPFNLLGLPTISVPCGFTRSGLPIGMLLQPPPSGRVARGYLSFRLRMYGISEAISVGLKISL